MAEQVSETTHIGRIKWFNNKKGFGFLSNCETNEDVFIHHSGIKLNEETLNSNVNIFKTVIEGEYVSYQKKIDDENRSVAKNVTGVNGGPLLCENVNKKIFVTNRVNEHSSEEGSTNNRRGGRGRGGGGHSRRHHNSSEQSSSVDVPSTETGEQNAFSELASSE